MSASGQIVKVTTGVGTPQIGWRTLQAAAAEHGAAAADFSSGWGFSDQTANLLDLFEHFSNSGAQYQLGFYSAPFGAENPEDADTASIELVGYANASPDGTVNPPIYIASFAAIVGTMPVEGVTNGLWFDTLSESFLDYEGDVEVFDSGANRVARALVDMTGLRYLRAYLYGVAGGDEAPSVAMVGRTY